jgi:two-component system NtrC family sensor kinase
MGVSALVLASILAFLYAKTRAHDDAGYYAHVATLRQLKQLDSRWELDVLKSRMGINRSYDALTDPLGKLNELLGQLRSAVPGDALGQAVEEKTRMIERFKSQNAVLRNSLTFLPTAAEDVGKAADRGIASTVNGILLDTLVYSQAPSDEKAAEIRGALAALDSGATETLDIFSAHVQTVLREQPAVNGLLTRIAEVSVAARVDELDTRLSDSQREADGEGQRYRQYLLIFAAALIALLLYAATRLVRSHALIRRVNIELQMANATLEERVQDRTRELEAAQSELVNTARQAGMAEIANNVLHNVGNVLNSVNVSAGLVSSSIRESRANGLTKAIQLMNAHESDFAAFLTQDEKGKALPAYLKKLDAALTAERENVVAELTLLMKSIDHIKDIVSTQQSYAGTASVVEPIQIRDLVEDALRINAQGLTKHQVSVRKDIAEVPSLPLDKHLVLQILVNLIGNARQAMDGLDDRAPQITVRVAVAEDTLRVQVADNGTGIAPENMSRLFTHGFTTRKKGHGFGLHSCALAAKQMGGTLQAASEGPGRGAAFTLELPMQRAEAA